MVTFQELDKQSKYISLTTYYKNGKGVATPVEFAEQDGLIYVNTRKKSWKVKRIKGNPKGSIALCTMRGKLLGEKLNVNIRILPKEKEAYAQEVLNQKLTKGFNKFFIYLFKFMAKLTFWKTPDVRVFLEISPTS
ncbi:MAG: PPOX class F420-dependent oxidoreductase [Candidatus Heimdallarchaeota archaeon]|nr:PPOX class F420-dependent oxidoreductase [Candidatus Heimdallarchaeota archaeon]